MNVEAVLCVLVISLYVVSGGRSREMSPVGQILQQTLPAGRCWAEPETLRQRLVIAFVSHPQALLTSCHCSSFHSFLVQTQISPSALSPDNKPVEWLTQHTFYFEGFLSLLPFWSPGSYSCECFSCWSECCLQWKSVCFVWCLQIVFMCVNENGRCIFFRVAGINVSFWVKLFILRPLVT